MGLCVDQNMIKIEARNGKPYVSMEFQDPYRYMGFHSPAYTHDPRKPNLYGMPLTLSYCPFCGEKIE